MTARLAPAAIHDVPLRSGWASVAACLARTAPRDDAPAVIGAAAGACIDDTPGRAGGAATMGMGTCAPAGTAAGERQLNVEDGVLTGSTRREGRAVTGFAIPTACSAARRAPQAGPFMQQKAQCR